MAQHKAPSTESILAGALEAGLFPEKATAQAESILEALRKPARVTLLGLPHSGKTGVGNLLAGEQIIPVGVDLGTVRLTHGAEEAASMTMQDGKVTHFFNVPTSEEMQGKKAAMTEITAPLAALSKITLMEIGRARGTEAMQKALNWAAGQTDIAIWCTEDFSEEEQELWAAMPPHLQDHAILLRTKCETLNEDRDAHRNSLEQQFGKLFSSVICISTREAEIAKIGSTIDKSVMRASGGMKLISTVLKTIERGKSHAIDSADVLIAKHEIPDSVALSADDAGKSAAASAASQKSASDGKKADQASTATEPRPEAVVIAFKSAADQLRDVGRTLLDGETTDTKKILNQSAKVLNLIDSQMAEDVLESDPAVDRFQSMIQHANDLVQLMKLEGDEHAKVDAISLLLQLKRELLAEVAA